MSRQAATILIASTVAASVFAGSVAGSFFGGYNSGYSSGFSNGQSAAVGNSSAGAAGCQRYGSGTSAADIYFLPDTTSSMGSTLRSVQSNVELILGNLTASISDAAFGAGEYRDFSDGAPYPFLNAAPLATDRGAGALAAIRRWDDDGGGDGPEGQLYALWQVRPGQGEGSC